MAASAERSRAIFLPSCVTCARQLRKEPAVPRRAKLALLAAAVCARSPIDLIPRFLPVIGRRNNVVGVALALRCAARGIPRPVLLQAWPEDSQLLERILRR